ncbi:protein kinase [bacterium]|nr:protein kinase [bacterium]
MSDKTVEFLVESGEPELEKLKTVTDEMPGRYEVIEELARGGSGRILVVLDRHVGRKIAMKELLSDISKTPAKTDDPQVTAIRNRFLREARVTGRLEHPSIVPVYEIGCHADGSFYYTMRLVKGTTLLSAIKRSGDVSDRLSLLPHFYHVCNAVAYAHSKGVINRDLKPSNVMIGEFGETVVLDWGLAKIKGSAETIFVRHEDEEIGKTVVGQAIGTPSYMPPEQAEGNIGEIDEISDIYSLGAILYQILTGKTPFTGKTTDEIIRKVLNEDVENAVKKDKEIPPELAAIAQKALSKSKENRYASVGEMLDDLSAYMSGRKVDVYHYSVFESLKFVAAHHKSAFIAGILIFVITFVAVLQISVSFHRTNIARQDAERGKITANYRTAQAFSEKSNKLDSEKSYIASRIYAAAAMYYNPLNKKSPEYSPGFSAHSGDTEEMLSSAASKFYIKNFHRGATFERDISIGCKLTSAALSHDEKIIAAGCDNGTVTLFNFPALSEIYKFDLEGRVSDFAFSNDDKKVLVSLPEDKNFIIDIQAKTAESSFGRTFGGNSSEFENLFLKWYQKENDKISAFALSPDGKTLLSGTESGRIAVFSTERKELLNTLTFRNSAITDIHFQKDATHFVTASKEGKIVVWDAEKLEPLFVVDGHDSAVSAAFFVGDDKLVSAGEDGLLRVWKRHGREVTRLFDVTSEDIRKAAFLKGLGAIAVLSGNKISVVSKNEGILFEQKEDFKVADAGVSSYGRYVVVAEKGTMLRLYDRESKEKKEIELKEEIRSVDFSPDSDHAAVRGDTEILLVSFEKDEVKSSRCVRDSAVRPVFSPGGKKLAVLCGGTITIFSVPDFSVSGEVKIEGRKTVALEFMPDSTLLAGFDKGTLSRIDTYDNSVMDFSGRFDATDKIAVSYDGTFAATVAAHNGVRIWNVPEHRLFLTIATEKEPSSLVFVHGKNYLGICTGGQIRFYPLEAPDLELPPAKLLRKMELEAGMELKDLYLETLTSEEIAKEEGKF